MDDKQRPAVLKVEINCPDLFPCDPSISFSFFFTLPLDRQPLSVNIKRKKKKGVSIKICAGHTWRLRSSSFLFFPFFWHTSSVSGSPSDAFTTHCIAQASPWFYPLLSRTLGSFILMESHRAHHTNDDLFEPKSTEGFSHARNSRKFPHTFNSKDS